MSASTLTMPRLSGARSSARRLVESEVATPVSGPLTLDAQGMEASSQSFADEIIGRVLSDNRATILVVIGPTKKFAECLEHSAEVRKVRHRLDIVKRRD